MADAILFNDTEFSEIKRDQQHEETKALLLQFIEVIKRGENEKQIIDAINNNSIRMGAFADALSEIKIEAPVVNVPRANIELRQDEVVKSLEGFYNAIGTMLTDLKKSNETLIKEVKALNETNGAPREFKVKYGALGKIESIIASIKR